MTGLKIDYRITFNETSVIKGVAICAMLWHHLFFESHDYGSTTFKLALTCKICVSLFVFLSGYGIATQFKKVNLSGEMFFKCSNIIKFMIRRYIKFYLNYWIVFFVCVSLGVFVFGRNLEMAYGTESNMISGFVLDVFGLNSFDSYNVTWWFNRLILVLWMTFPILYWMLNSKFVCIWTLLLLLFNPGNVLNFLNSWTDGLAYYIPIFSLGICIAAHIDEIDKMMNKVNRYIVLVVSVAFMVALLYMRNHYVLYCFLGIKGDPFTVVFLSLAVVCICRLTNRQLSVMAFLGKHSMNMYLMHTFIFAYFFHDFIYGFKYPVLIFLALLLTSLLLSIVLEFLKKKIGFYRLQQKIVLLLTQKQCLAEIGKS